MRAWTFAVAALAVAAAGCNDAPEEAAAAATTAAAEPCPDDGERLAGTGLCRGRAMAYLNLDAAVESETPEGCEWVVGEAAMPGDEYLLYRGLKCGDKETKIEFSVGAHRAELELVDSAFSGPLDPPAKLGAVYTVEGDPNAAVLARAGEGVDADLMKGCAARPAGYDFWPSDALVVDISPAEAAKLPDDGPRTACGPFGLDEDAVVFWRVFQGYAWYFNLGQDAIEIDPASLTIVAKDADGNWSAVEAK